MRLQRALARAGFASRRGAEKLIADGLVLVNGTVAKLGQSVDPDRDEISVAGRRVERPAPVWMALNKPLGHVVSRSDPQGRPTVFDLVPDSRAVTYVGRLDIMTSGLLLLTNDGEMANRLTHPRYEIEKTYEVVARGGTAEQTQRALKRGVVVEEKPVRLRRFEVKGGANATVRMTLVLTEGRNRIVRKMCDEIGLTVERLARTGHGPVRLGSLPLGEWRHLRPAELAKLAVIGR